MVDVKVVYPQELRRRQPLHQQQSDCRYRMIALDLDGTLLQSSSRQMSDSTIQYLRYLSRRGLTIAFCTGRAASSTYPHIEKLGIGSLPLVCTNGAKGMLVHSSSQTSLFDRPLSPDVSLRAHQVAKALGHVSLWYYDEAIYANATNNDHVRLLKLFQKLSKSNITLVDNPETFGNPSRIVVLFWDANAHKTARYFQEELHEDATVVPGSKGLYLEILSGHVHKGNGLQDLCDSLDIPLKNTIAIGDGDNDVEFLDMAGFGICMKNGCSETKKVADAVTQWTNDEDGVIRALQQLEALGMLQLNHDI
jgi:Cof subfamily protein (haloacid dehalogenase superfamily)